MDPIFQVGNGGLRKVRTVVGNQALGGSTQAGIADVMKWELVTKDIEISQSSFRWQVRTRKTPVAWKAFHVSVQAGTALGICRGEEQVFSDPDMEAQWLPSVRTFAPGVRCTPLCSLSSLSKMPMARGSLV